MISERTAAHDAASASRNLAADNKDWLPSRCHKTAGPGVRWVTQSKMKRSHPRPARRRPSPTIPAGARARTTARTRHRGVPHPPQRVVHRRLRECSARPPTRRTSSRRPGGDGRASTSTPYRISVHTWSGSPPARRSPGCARSAAAKSPTSAPGCPSRCSSRPTWPRTSSWPTTSRWRCC